jgi:sodium-dependent phosphate transporter
VFEADVQAIREAAKDFDPKTEYAFSYLQVFSACFDAFAHGANDVANAIGPLAAVCGIYFSGEIEDEVEVQWYVLFIGGVGIVVGLGLYGYNIIEEIGSKLTKLSPTRGFSIELGAALVVITGSRFEIPLSTTHCQIGATVGVGMIGGLNTINWTSFAKIVAGWVLTLVVAAVVTGLIFSFAVCAPSLGAE